MKKIMLFPVITFLFLSCSPYNVRSEIKEGSVLSKLKHTGIIFRVLNGSIIQNDEYQKNLTYWLITYEKNNNLEIAGGDIEDLSVVASEQDSFYQLSINNTFSKYKALGVATYYIHANNDKLKKIMAEKGYDSLLIYEVDGGYSVEMQFMDFNTMAVIVDSGLNVAYLDYQKSYFEVNEMSPEIIKKHLMDKISDRLLNLLTGLDYIKRK